MFAPLGNGFVLLGLDVEPLGVAGAPVGPMKFGEPPDALFEGDFEAGVVPVSNLYLL